MNVVGRSALGNVSGSTCCSIPACAVVMLSGIGRQHVRDGVATLKTEKSKYTVEVNLPILPVLAETLAAGPCGDLAFIAGARGKPMAKKTFSNEFEIACEAAGVPGSAHGIRKLGATRAANAGATVPQLKAIFGWTAIEDGDALHSRRPIGADWRQMRCTSLRTISELLLSHLPDRCDNQS